MARVYYGSLLTNTSQAKHVSSEQSSQAVAVRCFKADMLRSGHQYELEISIAATLGHHVNVVDFYGIADLDSTLDENDPRHEFGVTDLTRLAIEICRGMGYISSCGFVHGDLAARNVLVDHNITAKICDFGMARETEEFVRERTQAAMPVRWLAPESLLQKRFSTKSDVWAYGVTLWEIFTLGDSPYAPDAHSDDLSAFVESLNRGIRLPQPAFAPVAVWQLCLACWEWEAHLRPRFDELEERMKKMQPRASSDYYVLVEPERNKIKDLREAVILSS